MQREMSSTDGLFMVLKGAGVAIGISFLCALVFASVLQATSLPYSVIYPVNQIIKSASILAGMLLFVRGEKGWLKGLGVGGIFTALSYLTFSILGGFSLSWLAILELLLGCIVGIIGGIVAVNLKN